MLKYPEVFTGIVFIPIPTTTKELRSFETNIGSLKENYVGYYWVRSGIIMYDAKKALELTDWRQIWQKNTSVGRSQVEWYLCR